jgi:hypothetical protein
VHQCRGCTVHQGRECTVHQCRKCTVYQCARGGEGSGSGELVAGVSSRTFPAGISIECGYCFCAPSPIVAGVLCVYTRRCRLAGGRGALEGGVHGAGQEGTGG